MYIKQSLVMWTCTQSGAIKTQNSIIFFQLQLQHSLGYCVSTQSYVQTIVVKVTRQCRLFSMWYFPKHGYTQRGTRQRLHTRVVEASFLALNPLAACLALTWQYLHFRSFVLILPGCPVAGSFSGQCPALRWSALGCRPWWIGGCMGLGTGL